MTTVFDAAGNGSAKACWVLMRRAKRTSLSPQAPPQNLHCFRSLRFGDLKNRRGIGPHPGARKTPVISVGKMGYVRRSKIKKSLLLAKRARVSRSRTRTVQQP